MLNTPLLLLIIRNVCQLFGWIHRGGFWCGCVVDHSSDISGAIQHSVPNVMSTMIVTVPIMVDAPFTEHIDYVSRPLDILLSF